jgi:NADH:ubiquinone oxidoreductase subunit 3 (subunit A)
MLSTYLPALLMFLVATVFAVALFTLTSVLGTRAGRTRKAQTTCA